MNDEIDEKFKRKLKIGFSIIMLIVSIFVYILLAFFMLVFDTKIYQLIFSITYFLFIIGLIIKINFSMYDKTKIIFRIFTLIFIIYNFYYFCLSMFIEPVLHLHIKHDIPLFKMRVLYIMPPQPGGLFGGSSGRGAYIKYGDKEILVKWWIDGWYDEYDEQEKLDKIINSTY